MLAFLAFYQKKALVSFCTLGGGLFFYGHFYDLKILTSALKCPFLLICHADLKWFLRCVVMDVYVGESCRSRAFLKV